MSMRRCLSIAPCSVREPKDWKAIHMCGSMADAVPVADAIHNLSYLLDTPIAIRVREKMGKGLED